MTNSATVWSLAVWTRIALPQTAWIATAAIVLHFAMWARMANSASVTPFGVQTKSALLFFSRDDGLHLQVSV